MRACLYLAAVCGHRQLTSERCCWQCLLIPRRPCRLMPVGSRICLEPVPDTYACEACEYCLCLMPACCAPSFALLPACLCVQPGLAPVMAVGTSGGSIFLISPDTMTVYGKLR